MAKKYKCSYCEKRLIRKDLITHIDRSHKELIPENYTAARLVYNQVNKVDHGKCRVCGKPTTWSEKSGRYEVLCGDPKCKEHMREEYKKNMLRVRGTYNILNDPEQQKKMLANRSISGQYKFQDGGILTYTGSYEKKCLEFMDVVMQIPSKDILSPGPTLEYEYNGEKHFYITDFYYIPYNLIIEVKDGGDNLNTKDSASMKASREKTIEKERIITDKGEYNYIRLTNNNFAQLIEVFMIIKEKLLEGDDSKTYRINESQVILEDYFVDKKDIYYNKDKFDSGEINLCFITGLSGSGKTTMGKTMQSGNIEVYELDDIISNWNFSDANLKEYGSLVYSFFKGPGKMYRYTSYDEWMNDSKWDNPTNSYANSYDAMIIKDFIKYAKLYANSHKNIKFVLEGVWVFYFIDPKELDNCAVYIKGTSVLISFIRSAKRDCQDANSNMEKFGAFIKIVTSIGRMKAYLSNEKRLLRFYEYFASKVINESQIIAEDYFVESSNQLYHISNRKGITNINPSIPNNFMTKNGYEENKTKRVCFAPSVDQCLMGLSRNCEGEEFYVYAPDGDYKIYTPSIKEVPDVKITGEVWIKEPVNVKCVGKIKVLDTNKSPGKSYSYGNNQTAELYAFDYKWVKNINESQVVLENTNISDIRNVINKIYQKYLKDKKPPTGNQNCQLCTWCVESWFRGINVLPRPIYSPTDIAFEFNGYDIVKNPELIKFRSKEDFKRVIHSSGNGSRYYVHVKWNGGSGGHEFMAIAIDNIIYIIDAQQGIIENMDTSYVVKDYFNINYDESYMVRLDNKQFNKELLKYNNNKYIKQLTEDDMKMLEENAINEASRSNKFIRITYDGEGIYQAFKENVPFGVWKSFKNSNAANWLPLPPSYEGNYRSYFTTTGYKMFMKRTYPVMIEYLDKSKIKVEEVYLQQSNIIYEDKFQVVISEDNTIDESLEDISGIIFGKRKLFQDEITLYHGTDLKDLSYILPKSYNMGLKNDKPKMSSFWFNNIDYAITFATMTFVGTALNDKELNRSMMLDDNMTVLIEDKYKSNVISAIRGSKSYVYEKTIESSYVGYGHDGIFPEYTLDIPVKPDRCYVINDKQMLGHIKFVSEDYIKSVKKKYKNGRMVFDSTPLQQGINKILYYKDHDDRVSKIRKARAYNESCELSSSNTGIINPQWKIFANYMCTKYKVNNSIKINIEFLHSKVSFDTMSNKYNDDANTNATIRNGNTIYVLDEDIYNNLYHDNYNNIVRYEIAWIILSKYYNANMYRTIEAICIYESGMLDEFEAYNTGKIKRAKKYKEYVNANGFTAVMRHLTSNKAIIN